MTRVADGLREATARLAGTSDTARLDAELLMAHAFRVSRSELLLRHSRDQTPFAFADLVERRAGHEPVAYIVGEQEFYGRAFRVTPAVLIPRPDSETTVAAALEACPGARRILDCGTGSGALLLTVLAEMPDARGIGIDRSPEALSVANENAARLGLSERASFAQADWRQQGWTDLLGRVDLILCNPPYVEEGAQLDLSGRGFEPAGALFAGPEGLDDYRVLVPHLPGLLRRDGAAVLEIGASQAEPVGQIAAETGFSTELRRDLAGRPRVLILRRS